MKKRLLAALLAAAMVTTMAPAAFAVEDDADPNNNTQVTENVGAGDGTNSDIPAAEDDAAENTTEKQGGEDAKATASNLQSAIDAAGTGDTVTMSANEQANITINKSITLDLAGHTLTNAGSNGITLKVIDGATVTVQNGTIMGGAGNYNIQVGQAVNSTANLTLKDVTATAGNSGSSMIDNWGTLTIESGTYTGGLDTVKNESNATLTINGGKFTLEKGTSKGFTGVVFNYGTLTINDGEFLQSDASAPYGQAQVIHTDKDANSQSAPSTKILGGTFTNKGTRSTAWCVRVTNAAAGSTTVSGGKFNKKVTPSYLPNGYGFDTMVEGYYQLDTAITSVTLNPVPKLKGGESYTLQATVAPSEAAIQTITWTCSDKKVAVVNSNGKITARKAGEVTITAKPAGSNKVATCKVHIVDGDAQIGTTQYPTLAEAVAKAANNRTIKLLNDVDLDKTIAVSGKTITLDMNGHTIYNTKDLWEQPTEADKNWSLISVRERGNLTITGNGTLKAKENDCYAIDVQDKDAVLTVENGNVVGNIHAVYVTEGTAYIKGGTYSIQQKYPTEEKADEFVLNLYDASGRDGTAKIVVTGGTFEKFNPANCQAEGKGTNFLATGYITTKVGDNYVVKANANKNISDLDTAIKTIQSEAPSNEKKAAVDVIKNIDNADLANNSAAMGKLAALDHILTDTTSGSAKVTVTGESTVESIASNKVAVTNAALSADLTSTTAQNVKVTIADASISENAVDAAKGAAGITGNVDVQKLNISMEVNGTPVTEPTAPVVLEFPLPTNWKGCQIVCVDDVNNPEVIPTTVIGNKVKATFNHFSDYAMLASQVITSPNKYQIELTPTKGETKVYAGDTITFNVVLRQTDGVYADKISQFSFKPVSEMLTVTEANLNEGFGYLTNGEIAASKPATGISLDANTHTLNIGTITCKVNGFAAGNTALSVTPSEQSGITLTGAQYTIGSPLTVAPLNVTYDVIKVTFTNYKAGTEGTSVKTYYTSANSKELYSSLNELADRQNSVTSVPEAVDGSITNGTQYRLADDSESGNLNNWVAADGTTKYVDLVAVGGTGFTESINFNVSRVQLLEVADLPSGVEIDETVKTTQRDSKTYVDHNEDFIFTVPDAGNGMKNEVTVMVGTAPVTPVQDATNKNKYTVNKSDMNDSPVKIEIAKVIDLDVDDIKVFGSDEGFRKYSAYSGSDTLVLIKGKTGVKYTLTNASGAPEIFELPNPDSGSNYGYGEGFNLAALIPAPRDSGGDLRQIMLDYLKNTYHIAVADGSNTKLNAYDFDTNGAPGRKIDDVQATYDFSAVQNIAWQPTDNLLLKADVLTYKTADSAYNTARDGQVTTDDVDAFLYNYVYTNADRPADSTNP